MKRDPLPTAIAHCSPVAGLIIVPVCPYCGKAHQHAPAADGHLRRMADCFKGEYMMDIQERGKG